MRFNISQFITSVTGLSTIAGTSLLLTRKYDWAAIVFTVLTIGSLGVIWERYSRKAGAPLDIKVFLKKSLPEKEELEFIITHSPYPFLAGATYLLSKKKNLKFDKWYSRLLR